MVKEPVLRGAYEIRRTKVDGAKELTDRERQIIALVNSGLTNQQIAERLGLRMQTVKNHLGSIYAKLGVRAPSGRRDVVVRQALAACLPEAIDTDISLGPGAQDIAAGVVVGGGVVRSVDTS